MLQSNGTKTAENIWIRSLAEFRSTRTIAFCGVMAALGVVLSLFARVQIGNFIRIGFSELPNIVVDDMFGPVIGGIFGGILDVLKYLVKPTGAFFPGFTLSAVLGGLIYGSFFYRKKITPARVFAANLVVKFFVNIILNSVWLHILYNKAFLAMLPMRIVSNLIMLPIDTAIYYFLLKGVRQSGIAEMKGSFDL